MPLTFASVLSFIPQNLWFQLKKFIKKDKFTVFDTAFKLSTKYTPALLIVMMCLSFANQFVRNVEIDCAFSGSVPHSSSGRGGYGPQSSSVSDSDLNDFCWNHDTFLVAKAIDPKMRGLVTYPGVSGYDREKDAVIRQSYYKQVWLGLGIMAVVMFLPFFLWKMRGTEKMKGLVEISEEEAAGSTEEDVRVTYFVETLNFNAGFAVFYVLCKTLAAVTPILTWMYFKGFVGKYYVVYGWNVLSYWMDEDDPWPNPMDVLFPKMAKCQWSHYGFGGDIETKSAQCQLPMNNLTQWSFFVYWWWVWFIFIFNVVTTLRLYWLWVSPWSRTNQYRELVKRICTEDVDKARTYTITTLGGAILTRKGSKSGTVLVNLAFGDWLILSFLKGNLPDWKFREFIKRLVVTENTALQLRPMSSIVEEAPASKHDDNQLPKALQQPPEMGFLINPPYQYPPPPTYSACGTATTATVTSTDDDYDSPPSSPGMGRKKGCGEEEEDWEKECGGGGHGNGKPNRPPPPPAPPIRPTAPLMLKDRLLRNLVGSGSKNPQEEEDWEPDTPDGRRAPQPTSSSRSKSLLGHLKPSKSTNKRSGVGSGLDPLSRSPEIEDSEEEERTMLTNPVQINKPVKINRGVQLKREKLQKQQKDKMKQVKQASSAPRSLALPGTSRR